MVVEYIYINMVVLDGDVLQLARDLQRPLSPLGCPTAGRPT